MPGASSSTWPLTIQVLNPTGPIPNSYVSRLLRSPTLYRTGSIYQEEESCLYDGHSSLCWSILVCRAGLFQTALSHLHSQWADVGQGTPWWQPSAYLGPTWDGQTYIQATHPADSLTDQCNHIHHVGLDEQVPIFLYTMVTNLSNRKVAEHFQRVVTPSLSM